MRRSETTIFGPAALAGFRDAAGGSTALERTLLLEELYASAADSGFDDDLVNLGISVMQCEQGHWPGRADPAAMAPYVGEGDRAAILGEDRQEAMLALLRVSGAGWWDFDELPADVWDSLGMQVDALAEAIAEAGLARPATPWFGEPDEERRAQGRRYVQLRDGGQPRPEAAQASGILAGPTADLEVLFLLTGEGSVALQASAESTMSRQRYLNLGLMEPFRDMGSVEMPLWAQVVAVKEMMAIASAAVPPFPWMATAAPPFPWMATAAPPFPWPEARWAWAIKALDGLRTHLIESQAEDSPSGTGPEEVTSDVNGGGFVDVLEEEAVAAADGQGGGDAAEGDGEEGDGEEGDEEHEDEMEMRENTGEAPAPPPNVLGPVAGAVIEMLDEDGNVMEPPEAPPPPPPARLLRGREMVAAGLGPSLDNFMRVLGGVASRGEVVTYNGLAGTVSMDQFVEWCCVECVDAIVRVLPAQVREGDLPEALAAFSSSVLGAILVGAAGGAQISRLGRQGGKLTKVRFPCLNSQAGSAGPLCTVGVWPLRVLEAGARMGGPMLAFASDAKLAEMGEEDPGGFMGELAQLAQAAQALEAPAVTNNKKLSALKAFFSNN